GNAPGIDELRGRMRIELRSA
ncbi:MAG: hypothetical protein QG608_3658, partial [Actinomycetota bacterium]|nr:hypothetical protein [Actinomycetota bacterium]